MTLDRPYSNKYNALIFDLDDTLLDTCGQLIKPANREACQAMIDAGLDTDLDICLDTRTQLFYQNPRKDVFRLIAEHFPIKDGSTIDEVATAGHRAFFHRDVEPHITIPKDVYHMLEAFAENYRLHLVTSGSPTAQQKKIDILGLEPYFDSVHLVDTSANKGDAFQKIIANGNHIPEKVLCIGDRADREIRAANQLGLATCRVVYGEYSHLEPVSPEEEADISITHILHLVEHLAEAEI